MMSFFQVSLFVLQGLLAFIVGYLVMLAAAAKRAPRRTRSQQGLPAKRFLILVPAHNEERLLPDLLQSLDQLDYPPELYTVHVVADNCTDQTAAVARRGGAVVHERTNENQKGKGYALQWLLGELWAAGEVHDAVLFLDADSIVSKNFLSVMAARLSQGERVIQAYYTVKDPGQSWTGGMRYAGLAALHYLRPQGRMVLGGSAGLKGNGMVVAADLMKRHSWSASVTEDIELHMSLILDGERVTFAPDAIVWGEMPATLENSHSQNMRWEQGRLQMATRYVPRLLRASWTERKNGNGHRAFLLFDAAMEHLIPPFSMLAGATVLGAAASLYLSVLGVWPKRSQRGRPIGRFNLILSATLLFGQLVYLLAGLRLVRAPKHIYVTLFYVPKYVLWKIGLYVQILFGRKQEEWVRTQRNKA